MIEVKELTKSYGQYEAVRNVTFSVKKGEVVGFLGPNGAGKTTTMKIITGFMAPTSGEVRVAGFDVFENPLEVKRRIGFLPETPPVYGDMTVREYLSFVANLKGVERAKVNQLVDMALEKTQLTSVQKRYIQNLSKGFRQRVGISQALVSDPEILILDEPTVGLDPGQVAGIRELIQELRGQHTIVLSTHILPEVQATCERIIIINRGQIVAEDTLEGLSRRMAGSGRVHLRVRRSTEQLLNSMKTVEGVRSIGHQHGGGHFEIDTDGTEEASERLAAYVVGQGAGLLEMRTETLDLENIFLKLTMNKENQVGADT